MTRARLVSGAATGSARIISVEAEALFWRLSPNGPKLQRGSNALELGIRLRHFHLRFTAIVTTTLASTALASTALTSALAATALTSTSLAAATTLATS